jgi:hypothetical protein
MKRGHVTGSKRERTGASDWYNHIAEAHIARIEAEQAALSALTAAAKDALPGQDARIDKGAALVAAHAVWPLTSGSWLVGSQTDAQAAYLVHRPNDKRNGHGGHGWTCECPSFGFQGGACKHIVGAMIAVRMGTAYTPTYVN